MMSVIFGNVRLLPRCQKLFKGAPVSNPDKNNEDFNTDESPFDFSDVDFGSDLSGELSEPTDDFDSADGISTDSGIDGIDFGGLGDEPMPAETVEDYGSAEPPAPTDKKGKKEKKAKKEKPPKAVKEKKEKPQKVKKEKKPRVPREPGSFQLEDLTALGACVLAILVFLALNALVFLNGGLGGSNIMFLVFMDLIALIVVAVPFIIFKYRKSGVSLYEVGMGVAVVVISIGTMLLLAELWRYDFTINKARSVQRAVQTDSSLL